MALTMTLVPIVLLFLGFPIFVVLLATAAIAIVIFYSIPLTVLHQVMFGSLDSAALLAVPFFIFAGEIMAAGGISGGLGEIAVRPLEGQPADHDSGDVRGVRGDLRIVRGDRGGRGAYHVPADARCRL